MNLCPKCGLDHKRLGVRIEGGNLYRKAHSTRGQMVRIAGNGWGFLEELLEHHPEVTNLTVQDQDTYRFYRVDRKEFDRYAIHRTLDHETGPQVILPLKFWHIVGLPSEGISLQEAMHKAHPELPPQETQPHLFDSPANAQWFNPKLKPRRNGPKRH